MYAVEAVGLTRRFGSLTAVDHVDLAIKPGTIYGFLGSNGSGKSTMIRMLCGVLTPDEGKGSILGHDIVMEQDKISLIFLVIRSIGRGL